MADPLSLIIELQTHLGQEVIDMIAGTSYALVDM